MKLLPVLIIVLVICLAAIAPPATDAQAVCIPRPELTLSPDRGVPGDTITLSGVHFGNRNWVDIYYNGILLEEVQSTSTGHITIDITIPDSPRGRHEVMAEAEALEADVTHAIATFTVWPALTVSPDKGRPGSALNITGRGFVGNETILDVRYWFNASYETVAEDIPVGADGTWEVTFQVPASTRGEHKIDAWGSETIRAAVKPAFFEVVAGISIEPDSGCAGQSIVMTGTGFDPGEAGISILFDGKSVRTGITADSKGDWQASFEVPEMPKGVYSLTVEGKSTRSQDVGEVGFELGPGIILSDSEGHLGMELTVSGRGFPANEDVTLIWEDIQMETARTDEEGSFDVSFAVPRSPRGERVVKATVAEDPNDTAGLGTNVSAIFVMESDAPPVPEAVSPTGRVGWTYRATPAFDWSEVSDPSGVYYSLQIAASNELTADREFVDPMVVKQGLTATEYMLETGALPYGRYYWIVQAVDGAENESGWSEVHSFRAGLMPKWGFIAAIVVIGVFLLALVRMLIIRRTYYY